MVRPVFLRRLGAVVALLGIVCLLVALVLPWQHFDSGLITAVPVDYSLLDLLQFSPIEGYSPGVAVQILYLLPVLGACLVAIEGRRAWQGRAATRFGSALLLLSIGCALCGLIASPLLAGVSLGGDAIRVPPPRPSAGPGVRLASLGFVAVVAGGVLLAVGALLHRWIQRRTDRRASATTTG